MDRSDVGAIISAGSPWRGFASVTCAAITVTVSFALFAGTARAGGPAGYKVVASLQSPHFNGCHTLQRHCARIALNPPRDCALLIVDARPQIPDSPVPLRSSSGLAWGSGTDPPRPSA